MVLTTHGKVDKVLVDGGRAVGVEATVTPPEGRTEGAKVRSPLLSPVCSRFLI